MDVPSFGSVLAPIVDMITLVVVGLGVFFALRQRPSQFRDAKQLLVLSWAVFLGVVVVQLAGDLYQAATLSRIYTLISIPLIFTDVAILSMLSYVIYARQSEPHISDRIKVMFMPRNRISALLLIAFTAYLVDLAFYVLLLQPFTIVTLPDVFGSPTYSTVWDSGILPLLVLVLIGYLGYACGHLLLAARKLANRTTARTLRIFALGWIATGFSLFPFVGYFVELGVDPTSIGYLVVAISFSASVSVFRRESSLSGFFEPIKAVVPETHPFTGRLAARKPPNPGGGMMLLEFDPSSGYEEVVKDFGVEQVSNGSSLFVFTTRGKRVYEALQQLPQTRFFIMTSETSYPMPGSQPHEVLIPQGDDAVLLDILERTITTNPESKIGLVFDSISDLILTSGLEKSYKFLKQVLEMASDPRITALFLVIGGAHEKRVMNFVMSLFVTHLAFDASGLKATRHS